MSRIVYRFVRDLRLDDHAGLAAAASQGEIVPALIVDDALEERLSRSPRRAAYFCAAIAALDALLQERGSRLIVRRGPVGPALRHLAREVEAAGVSWGASYDRAGMRADERLQSELEEAGLRAMVVHDAPAIPPEETTAARPSEGDGYRAFVPYYEVWREQHVASYEAPLLLPFARADVQSESLPGAVEFGASAFSVEAGPHAASRRLQAFLEGPGLQYAVAANVPAEDRTSHLSADLSFGTIASRTVVRETLRRVDDPFLLAEERGSLRLFLRSLAMRDFFLQLSWYHPQTDEEPLQEKLRDFAFADSHPALDAWRVGKTGYPLVDAGIRQLRETGWMHPRVRAIAASFLCFDLGVDWRVGRAEWDCLLIEDDPALATGNWQWIAGIGADMAQYPRIYNPRKQARQFDPNGAYARAWIRELAHLPPGAIVGGGRVPSVQLALALFADDAYPEPVVDHERAAREFLARYRTHLESSR
ncbi:MAG: cryptochrome/photolyase family protein [Vulcanimicrobiaceae bacterium]